MKPLERFAEDLRDLLAEYDDLEDTDGKKIGFQLAVAAFTTLYHSYNEELYGPTQGKVISVRYDAGRSESDVLTVTMVDG
jgi:hypothetical protein